MKNEQPLVSIIMGVYNAESTLEHCIDSIIKQTYTNWEFIICDDCSTDNSARIIEKYKLIDDRIIVLKNEKNLRLAATLNRCLEVANGEYIARMDADDESLPERLEKEVCFLLEHQEYDVVGCSRIIFDEMGDKGIRRGDLVPTKEVLLKDAPFAHPTILMKKSVYDSLGGYRVSEETMRAEDLDLWFRFFANGYRGYNMPDILYRYREGAGDYQKRTMKAAVMTMMVYMRGYKLLKFPVYKWIWGLKPIVVAIIPNRLIMKYHGMC